MYLRAYIILLCASFTVGIVAYSEYAKLIHVLYL